MYIDVGFSTYFAKSISWVEVGYFRDGLDRLVYFIQIILRSELLSQIKGSIVVLKDRIHKELGNLINIITVELGNLINIIRVIKLG